MDTADLRSWQHFLDASLRLRARLNRDLTDAHSLTLDDFRLLHMLALSDTGSERIGTLADALVSSPSRISRQVNRLQAKNLATRATTDKDGRYILATITYDGRVTLGKAMQTYVQSVRVHYLTPLAAAETEAMAQNCQRIVDSLKSAPGRS